MTNNTERDDESFSLDRLFFHADVDDVTEGDDHVSLVFTLRDDPDSPRHIIGESLDDCLEQAEAIVRHARTFARLRQNGLTDEDIARLADSDETWFRGYIAGATDAADEIAGRYLTTPAASQPMMAAAGEPVDTTTALAPLLQQEGALEALTSGDGIAITLALIHPAKIVLA